jgi:hypothetical protein
MKKREKKARSEAPKTISGVTRGRRNQEADRSRVRLEATLEPRAAAVARKRTIRVASPPTMSEFSMARMSGPLLVSFWYHTRLGPSNEAESREREKEKTARARTGR